MIARSSGPPHGVTPRPVAACGVPCPAGLGRAGEPCAERAGHVEAEQSPHGVPPAKTRPGAFWRDVAPVEVREAASAHLTAPEAPIDPRVAIQRTIAEWSAAEVQLLADLVAMGSPLEVLAGRRAHVLAEGAHDKTYNAPNLRPATTRLEWARSSACGTWRALDEARGGKLFGPPGSVHASIAQVAGEDSAK